jgi:DNA-binding NtrC family response regulator
LFGHEKGSFTGAHETRKGYFETVNTGTIFLDEVGELPLETQARLLRVLESGEFIKVGSSKSQKTDVRVIAASNKDLMDFSMQEKFREDLYYRLSTVPIRVPSLRERREDIHLLFRKFSADFAEKYKSKPVVLDIEAQEMLANYRWPGNVRQLKNIAEQLSVLDEDKHVNAIELQRVLPPERTGLPMVLPAGGQDQQISERDIFYKVLFDLRKDLSDLKGVVYDLMRNQGNGSPEFMSHQREQLGQMYHEKAPARSGMGGMSSPANDQNIIEIPVEHAEQESLSLEEKEIELIRKALQKYHGKRKKAANELGISERTLYRKIKQYNLE